MVFKEKVRPTDRQTDFANLQKGYIDFDAKFLVDFNNFHELLLRFIVI